jgi:hypothetical protein
MYEYCKVDTRENMIARYIIRATSPCDYTKSYIYSNVGVNELLSVLPLFIFVLIN